MNASHQVRRTLLALVVSGFLGSAGAMGPFDHAGAGAAQVPGPAAAELERMQQYLDERVDRNAIRKALHTVGGRKVECVDIHAQPALKNPALQGHKLERAPKSLPAIPAMGGGPKFSESLYEKKANETSVEVAGCPENTVPIAEITLDDLRRFKSLDDYFKKAPSNTENDPAARFSTFRKAEPPVHFGPTSLHQYSVGFHYVVNWGAQANINIARMFTEVPEEFSLGQIWISGGEGRDLQTLEAGFQVYGNLYGDLQPHLFIYSTRDGYYRTGCYNNSCHDFVQVSPNIFPGVAVGPVSVPGQAQYELNVHWFKDLDNGSWWLNVAGQWVGYYPRELFSPTGVQNRAARFDFGGEIIDSHRFGRHTATDMGSGYFPEAWYPWAAYMRLLRYNYAVTTSPAIVWNTPVEALTGFHNDPLCYKFGGLVVGDPGWGSYFFYGGPGFDPVNCV